MSVYKGDLYPGCTVFGSFTTVTTTGAPTVLTGNPAPRLVAYKDANAACSTTGLTLAVNCNGRTGWNGYSVLTTDAFYSCGHDYEIVLDGGTVGGTCVSGYVVASFSLVNRSGLLPQNYGKRLTLTTGGAVNVNWAGVENCTNATTLSCTTAYSVQKVIDATSAALAVWDEAVSAHGTAGTFGKRIADIDSKIGTPAGASVSDDIAALPTAAENADAVWDELQTADHSTCGSFGYLLNCQVSAALQPEIPGRRLAVASTGEAGINWARVANCAVAQTLSCTTIYSALKVVDQVTTHPCSTVFSVASKVETHPCSTILSVQSVLNNVPGVTAAVSIDPCSTVYRLETVSQCVVRTIQQSAILTEPTTVYSWPASPAQVLAYRGALDTNCVTTTASTQSVCNRAASLTIASYPITCTSTIVHRGSAS